MTEPVCEAITDALRSVFGEPIRWALVAEVGTGEVTERTIDLSVVTLTSEGGTAPEDIWKFLSRIPFMSSWLR